MSGKRGKVVRGEASESESDDDDEVDNDMDAVGARLAVQNAVAEASEPPAATAAAPVPGSAALAPEGDQGNDTDDLEDIIERQKEQQQQQQPQQQPHLPSDSLSKSADKTSTPTTPLNLQKTAGGQPVTSPDALTSPKTPSSSSFFHRTSSVSEPNTPSTLFGNDVGAAQKKLRERNASLRKGLATKMSVTHQSVVRELNSSLAQMAKLQQTSQDVSHHLRVLTDDVKSLNEKLEIVTTYDFLPKFRASVLL